jgi:hypothetical protein
LNSAADEAVVAANILANANSASTAIVNSVYSVVDDTTNDAATNTVVAKVTSNAMADTFADADAAFTNAIANVTGDAVITANAKATNAGYAITTNSNVIAAAANVVAANVTANNVICTATVNSVDNAVFDSTAIVAKAMDDNLAAIVDAVSIDRPMAIDGPAVEGLADVSVVDRQAIVPVDVNRQRGGESRYECRISVCCNQSVMDYRTSMYSYCHEQEQNPPMPMFLRECLDGKMCPFHDFLFDGRPFNDSPCFRGLSETPSYLGHLAITMYDYHFGFLIGLCIDYHHTAGKRRSIPQTK